jgi:hypothetical protein
MCEDEIQQQAAEIEQVALTTTDLEDAVQKFLRLTTLTLVRWLRYQRRFFHVEKHLSGLSLNDC